MTMTTTEALKSDGDHHHLRLTCGDKWMVWYEGKWQVLHNPYRARKVRILIATDDESEAIHVLMMK